MPPGQAGVNREPGAARRPPSSPARWSPVTSSLIPLPVPLGRP